MYASSPLSSLEQASAAGVADKCVDRVNEALEPSAVFISSTIDGESRASRTHIGHGKLLPLLNPSRCCCLPLLPYLVPKYVADTV